MAIKKAPITATQVKIESVINAGSPPPQEIIPEKIVEEIKFVMTIPKHLIEAIENDRQESGTSRRSWFLMAAIEKLKRDGKLT